VGELFRKTTTKPRGYKASSYWIAYRAITLRRRYHETQRVQGQCLLGRFARGLCSVPATCKSINTNTCI